MDNVRGIYGVRVSDTHLMIRNFTACIGNIKYDTMQEEMNMV